MEFGFCLRMPRRPDAMQGLRQLHDGNGSHRQTISILRWTREIGCERWLGPGLLHLDQKCLGAR